MRAAPFAALAILLLLAGPRPGAARSDDDVYLPRVTRALVEDQFNLFDPGHAVEKQQRAERLLDLQAELLELEAGGEPLWCSRQMANEARWLWKATSDWDRLDLKLWVLGLSLLDTEQSFALRQERHDGSWGICYDEWFKKLDPMIDAFNSLAAEGRSPLYAITFLQEFSRPGRLTEFLDEARVSSIAATGVDRRDELGAVASVAAELVFKPKLRDYVNRFVFGVRIDDDAVRRYEDYLDAWQDPETGFWGPWYEIDGELLKATDLSFTYHIATYRNGDIRYWNRLVDTLLAIRDQEYPFGWRAKGRLNNHNAYDVVRLFKLGWPHLDELRRNRARAAIEELLDWHFEESLEPDGLFTPVAGFDSSVADATYFGVSFLVKSDFCSRRRPFWSDAPMAGAETICCRIAEALDELDGRSERVQATRRRLAAAMPDCPVPDFAAARAAAAFGVADPSLSEATAVAGPSAAAN